MNTKVLTTLEYTKIIDLLTEKADSEPGKKLCRDLVPSTDLATIRTAQRETKDALAVSSVSAAPHLEVTET